MYSATSSLLNVPIPLALILPDAVIWPLNVCVSVIVSPNVFEPSDNTIEEVTIDDVILVTFKLVALRDPNVKSFTLVEPEPKYNWPLSRLIANSP